MKSILMFAVLAAAPAMALTPGDNEGNEPAVSYLSWCDGNSIIRQDDQAQLYVLANCTDQGLVCKTTETYRGNIGSVVSASCVKVK